MTKPPLLPFAAAAMCAALLLSGCSFSKSSESSSGSSKSALDLASSPFKSSSESSQTKEEKYENDVADYTAEYVHSSQGDVATFRSRLSSLAERRGITNWESDHGTYVAIGRGLRKANLGKPQSSAFTESLSGSDPMKRKAIEEGLSK